MDDATAWSTASRKRQQDIERRMPPISNSPSTLPKVFWTGLVLGIGAFFLRLYTGNPLSGNGIIDWLALIACALEVLCIMGTLRGGGPSGWRVGRDRPSTALVYGAVALLAIFAVLHLLRGFGLF